MACANIVHMHSISIENPFPKDETYEMIVRSALGLNGTLHSCVHTYVYMFGSNTFEQCCARHGFTAERNHELKSWKRVAKILMVVTIHVGNHAFKLCFID